MGPEVVMSVLPVTRNPFRGKGLAVSTTLALSPGTQWSLTDLAVKADVSVSLVSLVVRELNRQGLVAGEVRHGRRGTVRATRRLFDAVGAHWPIPIVWVRGGHLPDDRPLGGQSALQPTGVLSVGRPRVYLRSVNELPGLVAVTGGALVSEPASEWEVAVLDLALPAGPVPMILAALELSGSPRGREILATRFAGVLALFDEPETHDT